MMMGERRMEGWVRLSPDGAADAANSSASAVVSSALAAVARLKAEGAASPADVILLVDAARLYRGDVDGLFKPIQSAALEAAIPAQYRGAAGAQGTAWFANAEYAAIAGSDARFVWIVEAASIADASAGAVSRTSASEQADPARVASTATCQRITRPDYHHTHR